MARASIPTLLPLDSYARFLGINPAHFNGGYADKIMPITASCSQVYWQHAWQAGDRVSREDLAQEIAIAEREIAELLGFWPAPVWIEDEMHEFPRHHRRDVFGDGRNVRGFRKSLIAKWGKFIEQGMRATTLLGNPTIAGGTMVFSDDDGDGFAETVTLTLLNIPDHPLYEYRVYFANQSGARDWEVRPLRSVTRSGAGILVIRLWSWQVIDPARWEAFPDLDTGEKAIKLTDAVYVDELEIRREFNDPTQVSARFFWEPESLISPFDCTSCGGSGCPTCSLTYQDGCVHVRDVDSGIVVPTPAAYDSGLGQWDSRAFTLDREPDMVKIFYRAGDLDDRFLAGEILEPMPILWQKAIAYLATSRIERPFCTCTNVQALQMRLRVDLSQADPDGPSYQTTEELLRNPLGTRRGEVDAWKMVRKLSKARAGVALV